MNSTGVLRHMTQEKNNLVSLLTHPLRQAPYDTLTDGKTHLSCCIRRKVRSWMNKHFILAISRKHVVTGVWDRLSLQGAVSDKSE